MYDSQENYYRIQSKIYDLTRWAFLFGRNELHELLKPEDQPEQILEIGCGTGHHLVKLRERYPEAAITGIDPSSSMLAIAEKKLRNKNIRLINRSYNQDSFQEQTFDLILCSYSLTMIPELDQTLTAIENHLKPDGILLAVDFDTTPSPLFNRWMKTNFVDFNQQLFKKLKEQFHLHHLISNKAYFGLWEYSLFRGTNQSSSQ